MAATPPSQGVDGSVGTLVELVAAGVVVLDPDGSARFANPTWTSLTGQPAPSWRGTGWLDVLAPDERADRKRELLTPFSRGANQVDDQSEPSGNGLGLAIAQQGLRSMGGDLHHSGVDPRGTRFTITLPAGTNDLPQAGTPAET